MLKLEHITKLFPGVVALDDVSVEVREGEVHVVAGENGAGKSTLMKVAAGIYQPDGGDLLLDGEPVRFPTPVAARARGIVMIPQELSLIPDMTVADNIACGQEPTRWGVLSRREVTDMARRSLAQIGADLDLAAPVRDLSVAQQQFVEIARALASSPRMIIMDEPTDSLSQNDSDRLLSVIGELRRGGTAVLYISHRLPEIVEIADRTTVLRDGRFVETIPREELSEDRLVTSMIGRELAHEERAKTVQAQQGGAVVLRAANACSPGRFAGIDLELREGEIVGLAGLVGAGRTEFARALFGLDEHATGAFELGGQPYLPRSPQDAVTRGLAYVPEDRKQHGIIATMSIRENISISFLGRLVRHGMLDLPQERVETRTLADEVSTRRGSMEQGIATLSGGNQQKAILARWLGVDAKVLILDEPTRGVDVGAKEEIHKIVRGLAEGGAAVLLISSEVEELVANAPRILVMKDGRLVGELSGPEITEDAVRSMSIAGAAA